MPRTITEWAGRSPTRRESARARPRRGASLHRRDSRVARARCACAPIPFFLPPGPQASSCQTRRCIRSSATRVGDVSPVTSSVTSSGDAVRPAAAARRRSSSSSRRRTTPPRSRGGASCARTSISRARRSTPARTPRRLRRRARRRCGRSSPARASCCSCATRRRESRAMDSSETHLDALFRWEVGHWGCCEFTLLHKKGWGSPVEKRPSRVRNGACRRAALGRPCTRPPLPPLPLTPTPFPKLPLSPPQLPPPLVPRPRIEPGRRHQCAASLLHCCRRPLACARVVCVLRACKCLCVRVCLCAMVCVAPRRVGSRRAASRRVGSGRAVPHRVGLDITTSIAAQP